MTSKKVGFVYRPEVKRALWILIWSLAILFVGLEFFYAPHSPFEHHGAEGMVEWYGFYSILGFVSCVVLILIAKFLGLFLKVGEDYYDKSDG